MHAIRNPSMIAFGLKHFPAGERTAHARHPPVKKGARTQLFLP
jgi:hypothetical protein